MTVDVEVDNFLVGAIAEGRVCAELAVAYLVVAALVDIKVDGAVSGDGVIAEAVTPGVALGDAAGAVPVDLQKVRNFGQHFQNLPFPPTGTRCRGSSPH